MEDLTDTQALIHKMYKDEYGVPILASPGQDYIFRNVSKKEVPRVHIMCHTRFGKSLMVALAVLTRVTVYPEKWAIIAGEKDKARIIMDHLISHIFDNEFTASRFIPDKGESIDEIRRHRSKDHLSFVINPEEPDPKKRLISEVSIGSAKLALGKGAKNVVEDEAAKITDNDHSLVMRMLGDDPFNNFLCKIGNPFTRGHFLDSFKDPTYRKIVIDCYRSLKEGRMSQSTIEENRKYSFFKILYECKFPREGELDDAFYMQLLLEEDIRIAEQRIIEPIGRLRLGLDVCKGGRNYNVWVIRGDNYARVVKKNNEESSVKIADTTIAIMKEYGVDAREVFVDDTGVGHGVVSVLKEKGHKVNPVNNAEKARESKKYINIRAESYSGDRGVGVWIKQGAKLYRSEKWPNCWDELLSIKHRKKPNDGRTQIKSKEDMIKEGNQSPDVADALALTFAKVKNTLYTNINPAEVLGAEGQSNRPWGGVERFIEGIG